MENVFQFQHEAEKINDALGLSYEQDLKCREAIFFSAFSNYFIGRDLFDSDEERPKSLSTLTGDLEKALSLIKDEREKSYLLLLFRNTHNLALEVIARYKLLQTLNPSERKRMDLLFGLLECKLEDKKNEEEEFDYHSPTEMFKRIDFAKESLYNFQNYLNLVNEKL